MQIQKFIRIIKQPFHLKFVKKCNIGPDDIIEWILDDDGKVTLNFRKKVTFKEMRGSIDLGYKTNSVKLEKELYK